MATPLNSALALLRRAALPLEAPAVTVRELLRRAAADTSGTPVDAMLDERQAEEEAIGLLRQPSNAEVLRAAAQRLREVSAEADARLVSLLTRQLFAAAIAREDRAEEERRAAAAQYTEPEALFAALHKGDVMLLSARWVMARAGYEEEEVDLRYIKVEDEYSGKKKVKKWFKRREALPLPCRQEIEAQHPEAILSADQIERLYGQLKRDKNWQGVQSPDALPILSASHCWETRDAPDPEARTLTTIAKALAGEWDEYETPMSGLPLYARWGFEDVGIFFDYSSLFQNKPIPRTPTQDAAFKRALAGMSMW